MSAQLWASVEEVAAARRRFEDAIAGWRRPVAFALGRVTNSGVDFVMIDIGESPLPAVVLATVCGHRAGSASYALGAADLGRAIDLLAPAEACTAFGHPNLYAWRWLHADLAGGGTEVELVAVFADRLDEPSDDPYVGALRSRLWAGRIENADGTTTLWRPVGPDELRLIEVSGWRAFPPRLPDQPIFYPVLSEDYAIRIAREWNAPASGAGYVTRFRIETAFARRYPSRTAGGRGITELWVPAADLPAFNAHLAGPIEITAEFHADAGHSTGVTA